MTTYATDGQNSRRASRQPAAACLERIAKWHARCRRFLKTPRQADRGAGRTECAGAVLLADTPQQAAEVSPRRRASPRDYKAGPSGPVPAYRARNGLMRDWPRSCASPCTRREHGDRPSVEGLRPTSRSATDCARFWSTPILSDEQRPFLGTFCNVLRRAAGCPRPSTSSLIDMATADGRASRSRPSANEEEISSVCPRAKGEEAPSPCHRHDSNDGLERFCPTVAVVISSISAGWNTRASLLRGHSKRRITLCIRRDLPSGPWKSGSSTCQLGKPSAYENALAAALTGSIAGSSSAPCHCATREETSSSGTGTAYRHRGPEAGRELRCGESEEKFRQFAEKPSGTVFWMTHSRHGRASST